MTKEAINADELSDDDFIEQLEVGKLDNPKEEESTNSEEDIKQEDTNSEELETSQDLLDEEDSIEDDHEDDEDFTEQEESELKEDTEETHQEDSINESETEDEQEQEDSESVFNYKEAYEQILSPFKANGKTIEVHNPDEVRKLMQMGANYTKKMQEMGQHRKVLSMLDKKGLLDESKISYLIDLDQKDPEAIKKLIKEAGIDPLDIDLDEDSKYTPNKHIISNKEIALKTKLDDIKSTPSGSETLNTIYKTWDSESKDALWDKPEILDFINTHRNKGIYDQIVSEVDRQRYLGNISPEVPFIQAYIQIGNAMTEAGAFKNNQSSTNTDSVVHRKTVAKKKSSKNVNAAKLTKSSSQKVKSVVNYDDLSDDEFLKQMKNRV